MYNLAGVQDQMNHVTITATLSARLADHQPEVGTVSAPAHDLLPGDGARGILQQPSGMMSTVTTERETHLAALVAVAEGAGAMSIANVALHVEEDEAPAHHNTDMAGRNG